MIKLVKNGMLMEVRNDLQASAFLKYGYKIAEEKAVLTKEVSAPKQEVKYGRSEIIRMNTADLKALAPTVGVAVTEASTGAQLKEQIIAKLGL